MGLQQFSMTEVASLEKPRSVNLLLISFMPESEASVDYVFCQDGLAGTDWLWTAVLLAPWSAASSAAATTPVLATWEL